MVGKGDKPEDDELQKTKPFVPEFCFIPAEPGNGRVRRVARSHVMREFKRRERWQYNKDLARPANQLLSPTAADVASSSGSPEESKEAGKSKKGKLHVTSSHHSKQSTKRREHIQQASNPLPLTAVSDKPDPFDSYQKAKIPNEDMLMHYYTTSFAYYCFPLDQRPETHPLVSKWVPFMMTDSLLLRAALLSCAVHLENLQGRRDSLNAGLLRMSTIILLRERIQDQELSISDQSIGAVLTLAGVEFEIGEIEYGNVHLKGLKRMVEARGGIESVGRSNILLARILIWTSMVMGTKPQYPHLVDVGLWERPQLLRQKRSIPLGSSPSKFSRLDIDGETLELLLNIQRISRLITLSLKNVSPMDPRPLQDAISYLLHSVLTVPSTATASCCCSRYAGALYILFFANSRFPNPDRMISRLIDDLRVSIERVEFEKRGLSSFAFWLLSVGGVAAAGQPRRSWFVARLMKLASVLNLESWDDVRDVLARFLWIEPICNGAYKSLWEEVGYMKEGV